MIMRPHGLANHRAAKNRRKHLWFDERGAETNGAEVLCHGHPVDYLVPKNTHAESPLLAENAKFINGLKGMVVAGGITKRRHHAAGHIDAKLDVFYLLFRLRHLQSLGSREEQDGNCEKQRRHQIQQFDERFEPIPVFLVAMVERESDPEAATPPLPQSQKDRNSEE
jgi:hypothetical protein